MERSPQQIILDLTERILIEQLQYVVKHGTFVDVEDMDGRGGTKTQRLSNTTGLGEVRMIRSMARKELGLDQPTQSSTHLPGKTSTPLLSLIQSGQITLPQINDLGVNSDND
jgi:hypothetical protein